MSVNEQYDTDRDDPGAFGREVDAVRGGADPEEAARRLYDRLDEDERLGLLDGDEPFWRGVVAMGRRYNEHPYVHGAVARLGIPGTRFVDGPRGCVSGSGTAFPVAMARGATWDPELEERVGDVIGREVRAVGGNFFGGVCINLLRHPAWGRAQETYGDDPFHLGEMGAALVRGSQRWVMACVKHFALNSMENARFVVDVTVDEATLHDVYLPHFRRTVDQGAAAVMGAYNSVNGEWAGQHPYLLTDVLRGQWGFAGVTVTDFVWGFRDGGRALEAGMDIEEPFAQQRATHLRGQLDAGEASWTAVERSGVRILATQLRSYASREEADPPSDVLADADARALAREVAGRSMVLLRNEPVDGTPVLPIDPATVTSIALVGRLADAPNMGDLGSSLVRPPSQSTPRDGLVAAFPDAEVHLVVDDDVVAAADAATRSDVAVVVVGFDHLDEGEYISAEVSSDPVLGALFPPMTDEDLAGIDFSEPLMSDGDGEGGDRRSLRLREIDEQLIAAVVDANPRTVVVLVAAGAVMTEAWRHQVPALVVMWYAGMEGGHALGDVLTGAVDPSGRLPFSIPTSEGHLPFFDRDATSITYDRWHGQRLLDRLCAEPAFPHGFGLSYTTFRIAEVAVTACDGAGATLTAVVANTGGRDGRHVVQVYGSARTGPYAGERMLVGFRPVAVPAGASVTVDVDLSWAPLAVWDGQRRVAPAPEDVDLWIGGHARDPDAVAIRSLEPT